ncbi:hypothetical protein F2Q69_00059961 [Brassica cretica]|uniref:Uncharacterized protein n=1 Tax=Brassica cretica TaxID=69181 RepID=A0A8S9RF90_BRACR|nr:hypothetical protein F2Q69_00059961 [Brassica cretica]
MEVVSNHLDLYWMSYDRFTRGISTLTRVRPTRVLLPGREKRKMDERAGAGRWTRVSLPGRPHQKLDEELTRVGRRGLRLMTSTQVAGFTLAILDIFLGYFRLSKGNH